MAIPLAFGLYTDITSDPCYVSRGTPYIDGYIFGKTKETKQLTLDSLH